MTGLRCGADGIGPGNDVCACVAQTLYSLASARFARIAIRRRIISHIVSSIATLLAWTPLVSFYLPGGIDDDDARSRNRTLE